MTGQISNPTNPSVSQPMPPISPRPAPQPGGYAIAAFVLGIISFVGCGACAGIPALIFGLIELRNIKNLTSPAEGKPYALAGAILGGVNSVILLVVFLFYLIFIVFAVGLGLSAPN